MKPLHRTFLLALAVSSSAVSPAPAAPGCPAPGAADPDILAKTVRYAIPPLDCVRLRRKIDFGTKRAPDLRFLRTVVPWYWDFLRRDRACAKDGGRSALDADLHAALADFTGLCAGDAHYENFAVFYPPSVAAPTFGVNDPDDAGKSCPVLADFARLLVSVEIGIPTANLAGLVDRYLAELASSGPPVPASKAVKRALAGIPAKKRAAKLPRAGTPCPADVFARLVSDYRDLRAPAGVKLDPAPKPADCVDVSRSKDSGGSGGLRRYVIRFSEKSGKTTAPVVVTFKGTQKNATAFYAEDPAPWSVKERYAETCVAERGSGAAPCPVVAIDGSGYGFFARVKHEREIPLGRLGPAETQAVLEDEAAVLANLHRAHLDDPARLPAYREKVKALRAKLARGATRIAATATATAAALRAELAKPGAFERACSETTIPTEKKASPPKSAGETGG